MPTPQIIIASTRPGRLRRYQHQPTEDWSARVDAADVHPEYNHSCTAPLKNAIDFLRFVDEDEVFEPNDVLEPAADPLLDELVRVEAGLRPLREAA